MELHSESYVIPAGGADDSSNPHSGYRGLAGHCAQAPSKCRHPGPAFGTPLAGFPDGAESGLPGCAPVTTGPIPSTWVRLSQCRREVVPRTGGLGRARRRVGSPSRGYCPATDVSGSGVGPARAAGWPAAPGPHRSAPHRSSAERQKRNCPPAQAGKWAGHCFSI